MKMKFTATALTDGKTLTFTAIRHERNKNDYGSGHYFTIGNEANFADGGEHLIDGRYDDRTVNHFEQVCVEFISDNYRVDKASIKRIA